MPNLKIWKSQQLHRLRIDSERMFDQLCSDFGLPSVCQPLVDPDMTMQDTPDSVIVEAHLAGMNPENMLIEVEESHLVISCKHQESCTLGTQSGVFEQRFTLPCRVRTKDVTASFDGECLIITMPKCTREAPRRIPITIIRKR